LLTTAGTTVGMVPFVGRRAARRVKTAAAINVSKVLLSAAVTVWLVAGLHTGVWGAVVGSLVGESVLAIVQLAMTFRSFLASADLATWRRMAAYGLPF